MTTLPSRIYALLVGIDSYPAPVRPLSGCCNDINAFERFLQDRVDGQICELHCQTLLNENANRQAVIEQFERHLGQAGENDLALFYFSGHGSQEPVPAELRHLEPDGFNETLICWDSRSTDWDLADKEIACLLQRVARRGPRLLVVLDACHSGSGTRGLEESSGTRHAPADQRHTRQISDYLFSPEESQQLKEPETKATLGSGWNIPRARHVLLSACRSNELANECHENGQARGVFSLHLLNTLQSTGSSLTVRGLFQQASARVRGRYKNQTPQLEATKSQDLDLPVLGSGAIRPQPPFFSLQYDEGRWWIDGGAVHGLVPSATLAVYPLDSLAAEAVEPEQALTTASVVDVQPQRSVVELMADVQQPTNDQVWKAVVTGQPLPPYCVVLEGDDPEAIAALRKALETEGQGDTPGSFVKAVSAGTEADWRVLVKNGEYLITPVAEVLPLVMQRKIDVTDSALNVIRDLKHMARWTSVLKLETPASSRLPSDAVTLDVRICDSPAAEQTFVPLPTAVLELSYRQENDQWLEPSFELRLNNNSDVRLFCTLLDLPEDYSISAPFFDGHGKGIWLEPGESRAAFSEQPIPATIPDELIAQGDTEYQDILKLIICTSEFDASLLEQKALGTPLTLPPATRGMDDTGSLTALMHQVSTRHLGASRPTRVDTWATSQITVITRRPRDGVTISHEASAQLGSGVTVQPHPHLRAHGRLTSENLSTRDVGAALPAVLRECGEPFVFSSARGVDPGLSALELQLDAAASAASVTAEQPLILQVDQPLAENEFVLPVAFDGEFYIPLGRGQSMQGRTEIHLDRLTDPVAEGKRSLGGSIRIFFRKLICNQLGLEFPYPILAAVQVGPEGEPIYEADIAKLREKVTNSKRIVLFLHGIIGDTRSIVPCLESAALNSHYDLALSFDYENLNTPIETLAEQLRDRLAEVGLTPGHAKTLHLVAHSMGGLVSRSFIEQKGGNTVVQHLFMLGTPNGGSPWSTLQDWATTSLGLVINGLLSTGVPTAVLGLLLGGIEAIDVNLDQMKPGSAFLHELEQSQDPGVPYTILAGNTSLIQLADPDSKVQLKRLLQRLSRQVVEFPFLDQPNDIAASVWSIKNVPSGRTPAVWVEEVACNHLAYFTDPVGLRALSSCAAKAMQNEKVANKK